jgi:hypothetical protein
MNTTIMKDIDDIDFIQESFNEQCKSIEILRNNSFILFY